MGRKSESGPVVGDRRQHQASNRSTRSSNFKKQASIPVISTIVRQKDPALKQAVIELANGEVRAPVENLKGQGRVREITDRQERFQAIARGYAESPQQTLVDSP